MSSTTRRSLALRRIFVAIATATLMLVLTACGAVIGTTMTVNSDGTGSRVMTLTLAANDVKNLTADTATVDASIRTHLPAELSYSGLTQGADGALSTTFTLDFASPSEYNTKALALLASGGDDNPSINFTIADSVLLQGVSLTEDFSSYGLLKWMFDGLVADGIVSKSNASSAYELGTNTLVVDGVSVTQGSAFDYTNVVDSGFDTVSMTTDFTDPENIIRTITYAADPEKIAVNDALYDEYFEAATPSGAELASPTSTTWALTFAGDSAAIAAATDQALDTTGSVFTLETGPGASDPATVTVTVVDRASCNSICSPSGTYGLIDTLTATGGYMPAEFTVDVTSGESAAFQLSPPIVSATTEFEFGWLGAASASTRFVVDNGMAGLVGDGFEKLFAPDGSGELTVEKGDKQTTYTVRLSADNTEGLAVAFAQWVPGSFVSVYPGPASNFFWAENVYSIDPALSAITLGHTVEASSTIVHLPFPQSTTGGSTFTYQGEGPPPSFTSSGLTFAGIITLAVLAVIIALVIVVLVRFRSQAKAMGERLSASTRESIAKSLDSKSPLLDAAVVTTVGSGFGTLLNQPLHQSEPSPGVGTLLSQPVWPAPEQSPSLLLIPVPVTLSTASRPSLCDVTPSTAPQSASGSLFDLATESANVPASTPTQGI